MDTKNLRLGTSRVLSTHSLGVPAHLPHLDAFALREADEVFDRVMALHAVVCAAFGFKADKALAWLEHQGLLDALTSEEASFLKSGGASPQRFQSRIEALWGLAWCLGLVDTMNFWTPCASDFASVMPNPNQTESGAHLRPKAALRAPEEIGSALDLSYCLHWIIRDAALRGQSAPDGLWPYIVTERRHALD